MQKFHRKVRAADSLASLRKAVDTGHGVVNKCSCGPVMSAHRRPPFMPAIVFGLLVVVIVLSASSFVGLFYKAMGMITFLVPVIAIGVTLVLIYHRWAHRRDRFVLCANGIEAHVGGQTRSCTWAGIESITRLDMTFGRRSNSWSYPVLRLETPDGRLSIGGWLDTAFSGRQVENIDALVEAIEAAVFPNLFRRALHSIEDSQRVNFGDFSADSCGLYQGTQYLPWDGIDYFARYVLLQNGQGYTTIRVIETDSDAEATVACLLSRIKNFSVLEALHKTMCAKDSVSIDE